MPNASEIKMNEGERGWWERVRARGAMWYLVNKGLLFLAFYPAIGCYVLGWPWEPTLLVEAWVLGLVCGGFVWMRKELRYRFTVEYEGGVIAEPGDE